MKLSESPLACSDFDFLCKAAKPVKACLDASFRIKKSRRFDKRKLHKIFVACQATFLDIV
jgi:hypothetical protein